MLNYLTSIIPYLRTRNGTVKAFPAYCLAASSSLFIWGKHTITSLKGSVLYIVGNHRYSMYKIVNKYYPLWKIKKYGVEILFLWGSISIWTNGYFGKIDNKTIRNEPFVCLPAAQSRSKSDSTSAVVALIFLSNT